MKKNKNAATESAQTISAIQARIESKTQMVPQLHEDAKALLKIVTSLDEENNQLAQRVIIAEGAVAQVRKMQTAKSSKKQAKIFRKLVQDDAKDYAREHVDEDAKRFYAKMTKKVTRLRLWVIGLSISLTAAVLVIGIAVYVKF